MRRRIALQSTLCEIHGKCLFCFAQARHGTSPSDGGLSECARVLASLLDG
jgi:hypothetical protein